MWRRPETMVQMTLYWCWSKAWRSSCLRYVAISWQNEDKSPCLPVSGAAELYVIFLGRVSICECNLKWWECYLEPVLPPTKSISRTKGSRSKKKNFNLTIPCALVVLDGGAKTYSYLNVCFLLLLPWEEKTR